MSSRLLSAHPALTLLTGAVLLSLPACSAFDATAQAPPGPDMTGSWRLLVTRDPGVPAVTYFLTTFAGGEAIVSQFSPGPSASSNDAHSHVFHGMWNREGAAMNLTVSGQETDANRAFMTLKFRVRVTFGADGNTLSGQWQGSATAEDGTPLGSGLRSVTGVRLGVEPLPQ